MWKKIEHKSYIRADSQVPFPRGGGLPHAGRPSGSWPGSTQPVG